MKPVVPALLLMAACGTLSTPSVADRTPVPASVRAIHFHLEDRVAVVAEGSVGAGFDDRLLAAVRSELQGRGLDLDTARPDLVLRLETRVSGLGEAINGEASRSRSPPPGAPPPRRRWRSRSGPAGCAPDR